MNSSTVFNALLLACFAAIGNALVTIGQKKAEHFENPFYFGAISLALAAIALLCISAFFPHQGIIKYVSQNIHWMALSALGLVLLNVFLYFLYRLHGINSYTLYSMLAIVTTSLCASIWIFHERMNTYYWLSVCFALITILCFMKGKLV